MRNLLLAALCCITSLHAQSTSGRHFQRDSRLPQTPAAAAAVEASASTTAVVPLQKLRSGRAWPRFHFGRLPGPATTAATTTTVRAVDASATRATATRRGFWRAHG